MRIRQLSMAQWVGVVVPPLAWAGQHVVGSGAAQALCSPGGRYWGISNEAWQLSIVGAAVVVILVAEAAAVAVFLRTRGVNYGDGPPGDGRFEGEVRFSRLHFMATAAIVANVLFLAIVLLSGITSGLENGCVRS